MLVLTQALGLYLGASTETCLFHWLTGRPCATCGSTRAVFALLHGHPLEALRYNPLIASVLLLGGLLLLLRATTGRTLHIRLGTNGKWGIGILAILLFLGNWIWVLRTLG